MEEITPERPLVAPAAPAFHYRRTALALFFGLVIGLGMVVLRLLPERNARRELEQTVPLTALEDTRLYTPPTPVRFAGHALVPVSERRLELPDVRMEVAGEDESRQYRVYTTPRAPSFRSSEGEQERREAPVYFLKTGPGEYLRFQPAP